mmetsp:Transcript_16018/g.48637  ORF Transcript_16018/g.48637 Transcript_16018/m.48637 type:complete len:98 (-) Transcript_16018:1026-1319(-)
MKEFLVVESGQLIGAEQKTHTSRPQLAAQIRCTALPQPHLQWMQWASCPTLSPGFVPGLPGKEVKPMDTPNTRPKAASERDRIVDKTINTATTAFLF